MHQLLIPRLDLCTFYFPFPIWLPVTSANRACEGKVDCGGTGRCRFFIAWAFHSPSHKRVHCTWHSHSLAIAPSSFFTPGIVGITAEQVFHLSRAFFSPLTNVVPQCALGFYSHLDFQSWFWSVCFSHTWITISGVKFFSVLTNDTIPILPTGPQLV